MRGFVFRPIRISECARHFKDTVGIIGNGAEGIHGEHVTRCGEQSETGECNRIGGHGGITEQCEGAVDRSRDGENTPYGRFQTFAQSGQNQRGRASLGGGGNLRDRLFLDGGEVLRDFRDDAGQYDAEERREERIPPEILNDGNQRRIRTGRNGRQIGERPISDNQEADGRDSNRDVLSDVHRFHRIHVRIILAAHGENSNDGSDYTDSAYEQRVDDELKREGCREGARTHQGTKTVRGQRTSDSGGKNNRRDQRDFIRLEDVCRHTGAVTNVIADVIGNRRSVAGIIFRDPGFDFTHKIGTDVGCFSIDTAADTHKERGKRATEAEADEHEHRIFLEDHEGNGRAEQAETDRKHAGHRTGLESDFKRLLETVESRIRDAYVATHGDAHAHVTREIRCRYTENERN